MLPNSLTFLILLVSNLASAAPGDFLKTPEFLAQVSRDQVREIRSKTGLDKSLPEPTSGISFYKVSYETRGLQGQATAASGLMIMPTDTSRRHPLLSFQHGTTLNREDVPSRVNGEGQTAGIIYAAQGYVVCAPDYLGLGDSPLFLHPYDHPGTEASSAADLLVAAKKYLSSKNIGLTDQLFITGYSQGGHATMALQKYLEQGQPKVPQLTASAPMAGAYDLSGISIQTVLAHPTEHSSAEVAYVILSTNMVYGTPKLEDAFRPRYLPLVNVLFDGKHNLSEVVKALPKSPKDLLKQTFVDDALYNQHSSFIKALRQYDTMPRRLDDASMTWLPKAPVRLFHGGGDFESPFENSVETYKILQANHCQVGLDNLGDGLNHQTAQRPAFAASLLWFESMRGTSE